MNIRILNNDLTQHGIAAGFESLEFVRAFNTKGRFALTINANNATAKYIQTDKIVYIDADKIGYIDKVTLERKSDKSEEYIKAEGVEIKDRLGRIIYPDASLDTDSYTGQSTETIVKSLINKNAGYLASESRQIPNLVTAVDQARGGLIDYSARYKDLSTEIYSLLSSRQMGLKAAIDFDTQQIIFDVAEGNDLTAQEGQAGGIALSLETKTALEIIDTDDRLSYKNLSVTAGLGEGANQEILEVGTTGTGYGRREVFTDARDIPSNDELATRGAQKLAETSKTRAVSARANSLGAYNIGVDYTLGDFVSVQTASGLYDAQVVKLKYSYAKDAVPTVDVSLNFDAEDILLKDIAAKHMDYDALLASGKPSGKTIAEYEFTDSNHSYIDFENLSINQSGGIFQIAIFGACGAGLGKENINLEYNGISSSSGYLYHYDIFYNSALSASNGTGALIGQLGDMASVCNITVTLQNGYPASFGKSGYWGSGSIYRREAFVSQFYSVSQSDITSLRMKMASGNFASGTKIKIYELG